MPFFDDRGLTSSIDDFAAHHPKLKEILFRVTSAKIVGNSANVDGDQVRYTKGSGVDLTDQDLKDGYTFESDTLYLFKTGDYEVDTANGKYWTFEDNSHAVALPGEFPKIKGTNALSPIWIQGTILELADYNPSDINGTILPNVPTVYGVTSAGLTALDNTYGLSDPNKTWFFFTRESYFSLLWPPSVFYYFPYLRRLKTIISNSVFETVEEIRTNTTLTFSPIMFFEPKQNISIIGLNTTITAIGFSNCNFEISSEYYPDAGTDQRISDCWVGYESKINHTFSPDRAVSKKEITEELTSNNSWPHLFQSNLNSELFILRWINDCILYFKIYELIVNDEIISYDVFVLSECGYCNFNFTDSHSRLQVWY